MTIQICDDLIYFIQFKNIKLAIDFDTCIFLGEIKNNCIELNANIKRFLLKKFKINNFDSFTKNLVHIKFLIKYSPILSKLIDNDELDDFEMVEVSNIYDEFLNPKYYVKFNKTDKKFFEVNSTDYKQMNNIDYNYINVEKELIDLLNKEVI